MSNFAARKKTWITKHGDPCTIIRAPGDVSTTARIIAIKRKTDFFSVNYLREGMFAVDSVVAHGDLVRNDVTGEQFFVMALQNKSVGGSVVSINTELYMVNCSDLPFQSLKQTVSDALKVIDTEWVPISSGPANVQHITGGEQYKSALLLPTTVCRITRPVDGNIMLDTRCVIDGKAYRVDDIDLTVAPGLMVLQVSVDTRK